MSLGLDDVIRALSSREGQITAFATLLLAFYVRHKRKPWPAAVLLAAVLTVLEAGAGHGAVHLLLHAMIFLILSSALFWALDRARNLLFFLALSLAGVAVFLFLV